MARRDDMPRDAAFTAHSSGEPRDHLQFAVAFHLGLTGRLWRARFADRMKGLNQSEARWSALCMISGAPGGISQTHLAERLGIQGPTLVKLLDGLEKQGLASRRSALKDRRVKVISLEAKGREMLAEVDGFATKMRAELFEGVSKAELDSTLRVLRHLSDQLEPRLTAA